MYICQLTEKRSKLFKILKYFRLVFNETLQTKALTIRKNSNSDTKNIIINTIPRFFSLMR